MQIPLALIKTSPFQVRIGNADDATIIELAQSLQQHGLLQPIKVRPISDGYELIYGHRRLRAMRYLGWERCEAIVEGLDDNTSHVQSLLENIQRKDISLMELGEGLRKLRETTGWSRREISDRLSISQSSVTVALTLAERLSDTLKPLVQPVRTGGRFVKSGLSNYQAYEIAITSNDPDIQEALASKVIREQIPYLQIREIRKLLTTIPPEDKEDRQRILETPWREIVEELSREATRGVERPLKTQNPDTSSNDRWHQKCIWNAKRLSPLTYRFFTIGYAHRSINQFIAILQAAQVKTVVDVRANPVSQFRPEFSKRNIEASLNQAGIVYVHMGELGVPSSKRRKLQQDHDYEHLFQWYDEHIAGTAASRLVSPELLGPIAIMCVELTPTECHRHRIAVALENRGFVTYDL